MKYNALLTIVLVALATLVYGCSENKQEKTVMKSEKTQKATISKELNKKPACCQSNIPARFK